MYIENINVHSYNTQPQYHRHVATGNSDYVLIKSLIAPVY